MNATGSSFGLWVLSYIVNALWQIPLLYLAARGTTRMVQRSGPALQHKLWVSTVLLGTLLPGSATPFHLTAGGCWHWFAALLAMPSAQRSHIETIVSAGFAHPGLPLPPGGLTLLLCLYGLTSAYFGARFLCQVGQTSNLRRKSSPVSLCGEAGRSWSRFCQLFGLGGVAIAVSSRIGGPVTLGAWKPLLLLPATSLAFLEAEDLDAALAHEGTHIQRRDFTKNLVYRLFALPVAFHPLTWSALSRLAQTREHVCDEMAAEVLGSRPCYARSLLRLALTFATPAPAKTLHAIGFSDANDFERRIMSLTGKSYEKEGLRHLARAAVIVVVVGTVCASAFAFHLDVAAPSGSSAPQAAAAPAAQIASGVMAGNILTKVQPVYPPAAREAKVSGSVILQAVIGKEGNIENLTVVSGPEELRASAIEAVRQWTYKPYVLNGEPTEVETTITVNYSIS